MLSRRRFAMPFALSGALAAVTLLGVAEPARATTGSGGSASATTAEVDLGVNLLNGSVQAPIDLTLNQITAPASKSGTALTAVVDGVNHGQPVNLLMAQVGKSDATVDSGGAHASVTLADAHLHAPGLPLTPLLGVRLVTASADCPAHGTPTAKAQVLGDIWALGEKVSLSASGTTSVAVPLIGTAELKLSQHTTTSTTAAATALELDVDLKPLSLNVAEVKGRIVLADVSCTTPAADSGSTGGSAGGSTAGTGGNGGGSNGGSTSGSTAGGGTSGSTAGSTGGSTSGATGGSTGGSTRGVTGGTKSATGGSTGGSTGGTTHLALTGGGSSAPAITGGAVALVAVGAGAVVLTRRRRRG